jgi:hypothetical protein
MEQQQSAPLVPKKKESLNVKPNEGMSSMRKLNAQADQKMQSSNPISMSNSGADGPSAVQNNPMLLNQAQMQMPGGVMGSVNQPGAKVSQQPNADNNRGA